MSICEEGGCAVETIRNIRSGDLLQAAAFIEEYLPGDSDIFFRMYEKYPDLFAGCFMEDILIGICYGYPFAEQRPGEIDKMLLRGIAVRFDYQKSGLGSKLLGYFEDQVRKRGRWTISVGSAGGYVDWFYLKNKYVPIKYCIKRKRGSVSEEPCNSRV